METFEEAKTIAMHWDARLGQACPSGELFLPQMTAHVKPTARHNKPTARHNQPIVCPKTIAQMNQKIQQAVDLWLAANQMAEHHLNDLKRAVAEWADATGSLWAPLEAPHEGYFDFQIIKNVETGESRFNVGQPVRDHK